MLKTYQFKTQCKGDIHSSKTMPVAESAMFRCSPLHTSISRCLSSSRLLTLHDAGNLVVVRIQVGAAWRPQITAMKSECRVAAAK